MFFKDGLQRRSNKFTHNNILLFFPCIFSEFLFLSPLLKGKPVFSTLRGRELAARIHLSLREPKGKKKNQEFSKDNKKKVF